MTDIAVDVPSPLRECFLHCEVDCVRECCGIDAISADSDLIADWVRAVGPATAAEAGRQLTKLVAVIQDRSHNVSSAFLNHYTCDEAARQQLLDFLAAFQTGLEAAA